MLKVTCHVQERSELTSGEKKSCASYVFFGLRLKKQWACSHSFSTSHCGYSCSHSHKKLYQTRPVTVRAAYNQLVEYFCFEVIECIFSLPYPVWEPMNQLRVMSDLVFAKMKHLYLADAYEILSSVAWVEFQNDMDLSFPLCNQLDSWLM